MKRIIPICIVGILLCTAIGAVAQTNDTKSTNLGPKDFTHTVFAEDGTATWCGYCHYAREALDAIYTSQDFPFYYVCLVDDKNTHAAARIDEYNIYGFPTVFFDYGYKVVVGGRPDERVELVVLDLDATSERGLESPHVGGADGAPPHGMEEGVQTDGNRRSRPARAGRRR